MYEQVVLASRGQEGWVSALTKENVPFRRSRMASASYDVIGGPSRDRLFESLKLMEEQHKPVTFKCVRIFNGRKEKITVFIWSIGLSTTSKEPCGHDWFIKGTTYGLAGFPRRRVFRVQIEYNSYYRTGSVVADEIAR